MSAITVMHQDAIGFVGELAASVNKHWFELICERAISLGPKTLDAAFLPRLIEAFKKHQPNAPLPTMRRLAGC